MKITFSADFPDGNEIYRKLRIAAEKKVNEIVSDVLNFEGSEAITVIVSPRGNGFHLAFEGPLALKMEAEKRMQDRHQ
jgi:hypothetical protein